MADSNCRLTTIGRSWDSRSPPTATGVRDLPDDCGGFLAGLSAPPAPFVPAELHFAPAFGLVVVGLGDEASHARVIAPIRQAFTRWSQW